MDPAAGRGVEEPPLERSTRGKTQPDRLRLLDAAMRHLSTRLWPESGPHLVVDLGFGEAPGTTLQMLSALRKVEGNGAGTAEDSGLHVLGVELNVRRAQWAADHCRAPGLEFRQGGFDLPLEGGPSPDCIRAMNVLRQYRVDSTKEIHRKLVSQLAPGGLVLEGTSNKRGTLLTCHLLRHSENRPVREAMLFCGEFERGFAPIMFRDVLPKDLRREASRQGGAMLPFFRQWQAAFEAARDHDLRCREDPQWSFVSTARELVQRSTEVVADEKLWALGALLWCPPDGVPSRAL